MENKTYLCTKGLNYQTLLSEFLSITTVAVILLIGGGMVLDNSSDVSASEFIAFIIIFSQ